MSEWHGRYLSQLHNSRLCLSYGNNRHLPQLCCAGHDPKYFNSYNSNTECTGSNANYDH